MIVVSDTTAITSLLKIDGAALLQKLFGGVVIPEAVFDELLRYHPALPSFIGVRSVSDRHGVSSLMDELDAGEAEAIVLAHEIRADYLLIDEKRGRALAEKLGLTCLGLPGALLMAKQSRLIASVSEMLSVLETKANFYLSPDVKKVLLQKAGEM